MTQWNLFLQRKYLGKKIKILHVHAASENQSFPKIGVIKGVNDDSSLNVELEDGDFQKIFVNCDTFIAID